MLCVTALLCSAGLGVEIEQWPGKKGGLWGFHPHAPAVVGVLGLLVAAHGALRAIAVGLVPVA